MLQISFNSPSNDSDLHRWLNGKVEIHQSWWRIDVIKERHILEFNQTFRNVSQMLKLKEEAKREKMDEKYVEVSKS